MNIVIANRQRARKINARALRQMMAALLAELKVEPAELGIHLVGAREMARINWQFLQHEGSTDVITFDHREPGAGPLALHGELFVCVDDALKQAREFRTSWPSEVVRYAVHGILHLLGYDDLKPDLRRRMKREENRWVRWLEKRFSLAKLAPEAKLQA